MQRNRVLKQILIKYNEILLFAVTGIINTSVDFGIFSFIRYLAPETGVIFAQNIGYAAGLSSSFLLNKYYTFKNNANSFRQALLFLLCNGVSLCAGMSAVIIFHNIFDLQEHITKLFFVTPLTTAVNFLGYKFIVFRKYQHL